MNNFIVFISGLILFAGCETVDRQINTVSLNNLTKTLIPEAVITGKLCWKTTGAGTGRSIPGANEKPSSIVKAIFEKDGSFRFVYDEAEITGIAEFTKNTAGRNILITHAINGISHSSRNQISAAELASKYSGTYLWERISFPGIPSEDFLVLVDLKAHSSAGNGKAGSINKNWVSKFYLR